MSMSVKAPALPAAWSYSRWELHELCPFKYYQKHVLKVQEEQSPAMARGDKVHKGVASYLEGKAAEAPPEATKHFGPFLAELRAFPDKVVEQQMGFTDRLQPTGWFGKDTWVRAIWDVGALYEDLTAELIDWKTGKKYGVNNDQMEMFAVSALWKYKPVQHVTTRLVYLDSGEEVFAEFPRRDLELLSTKWAKRGQELLAVTMFPPRPNDKCKWCFAAKSAGGACRYG